MKKIIKDLFRESRQYTPILVGFFAFLVIIALLIGAVLFLKNRARKE